jgi:hypothetical protein
MWGKCEFIQQVTAGQRTYFEDRFTPMLLVHYPCSFPGIKADETFQGVITIGVPDPDLKMDDEFRRGARKSVFNFPAAETQFDRRLWLNQLKSILFAPLPKTGLKTTVVLPNVIWQLKCDDFLRALFLSQACAFVPPLSRSILPPPPPSPEPPAATAGVSFQSQDGPALGFHPVRPAPDETNGDE